MIILDEDAHQQPKLHSIISSATLRPQDPVRGRSPTLPDYETSQAQQGRVVRKRACRLDSRFCHATLWALAFYVGITLIVAVPFVALTFSQKSRWHLHSPLPWPEETADRTSLHDGIILSTEDGTSKCSWSNVESNTLDASFQRTVPPTGTFSIRSNVTYNSESDRRQSERLINGTFTVDLNPDRTARDAVMSLYLQSSSPEIRKRTHVCFDTLSSVTKLFIYVPDDLTSRDFLNITIVLLLPSSPTYSIYPLQVKKLSTYLPLFTQHIADLDRNVNFNQASIEGPLSKVVVGSMSGRKILIKTSLAEIQGTFNVTESLTLDTIGAPINANISLVHEAKRNVPTYLSLDTGNSAIESHITLYAPSPTPSLSILGYTTPLAQFLAHVKTFNAPLTASVFYSTATGSTTTAGKVAPLHMHVQNSMAPTMVTLDERYEGTFDLKTKLADAVVQESDSNNGWEDDGDGQGERKYIYDHVSSSQTFGWVGSGKRPASHVGTSSGHSWGVGANGRVMNQGHVEIVNSLSDVLLKFGE